MCKNLLALGVSRSAGLWHGSLECERIERKSLRRSLYRADNMKVEAAAPGHE